MTRGELRNLALYWLDDLQAGYFTVPQMDVWLNNAQIEVQKQLIQAGEYWYLKCATTQTVQGGGCIALPSDFLKCNKLEIQVPGTLSPNDLWVPLEMSTLGENSVWQGSGQACPRVFTIGKDCLYLNPVPDQTYNLRLFYSYIVTPMVSDLNVPNVPPQYHEYLAVLAASDGFLKDGRDPSAIYAKRDYYVDMMKKDSVQRNRAQPRRVRYKDTDGYGGGGFGVGF